MKVLRWHAFPVTSTGTKDEPWFWVNVECQSNTDAGRHKGAEAQGNGPTMDTALGHALRAVMEYSTDYGCGAFVTGPGMRLEGCGTLRE